MLYVNEWRTNIPPIYAILQASQCSHYSPFHDCHLPQTEPVPS